MAKVALNKSAGGGSRDDGIAIPDAASTVCEVVIARWRKYNQRASNPRRHASWKLRADPPREPAGVTSMRSPQTANWILTEWTRFGNNARHGCRY